VHTKPGCKPSIYVGSSVEASRGLRSRISSHERNLQPAKYAKQAVEAGYSLSHYTVLAHFQIPHSGNYKVGQLLVLATEAAFSLLFWSMITTTKDYGFPRISHWDRESLPWGGLCSHNPLFDGTKYFQQDMSEEEIKAFREATRQKNLAYQNEYQKEYRKKLRATPGWKLTQQLRNKKAAPGTRQREKRARAEKKYYCEPCEVNCRNAASLHDAGSRLADRLSKKNSTL